MDNREHQLEVIVLALQEASRLCRRVQQEMTPDTHQKKDKSPVTVADFGSQALVCRTLHINFPKTPIIAEENSQALQKEENKHLRDKVVAQVSRHVLGATADEIFHWIDFGDHRGHSDSFWTLDPIDGTKGFLRGQQYALSAAYLYKGEIQVAALACPNLPLSNHPEKVGTLFTAIRGKGAFQEPLFEKGEKKRVAVSQRKNLSEFRFCESVESGHSSHSDSEKLANWLGVRQQPVRLDSQAKYAVVARGDAEIYLRLPTRKDYNEKIWDHAGGVLVVEEAGGVVTDVYGKPLDFSCGFELRNNKGVIVSNGAVHDQILQGLQELQIL